MEPDVDSRRSSHLIGRRHVLIGGAFAAASTLAIARQPTSKISPVPAKRFEQWVPSKFGPWSVAGNTGLVLPPPDTLRDRLYDNLVTQVYQAPGLTPVMLLLAYNNLQDGVVQVHRPEICYPVGGYELSRIRDVSLEALGRTIPANLFTAKGPNRTEQVVYFTRLGQAYPRNWGEQRWSVVQENLSGRIPDGFMLRVSLLGLNQEAALHQLGDFTSKFIAAADPQLQKLILTQSIKPRGEI